MLMCAAVAIDAHEVLQVERGSEKNLAAPWFSSTSSAR